MAGTIADVVSNTTTAINTLTNTVVQATNGLTAIATSWTGTSVGQTPDFGSLNSYTTLYNALTTAKTSITTYTPANFGAIAPLNLTGVDAPDLSGYTESQWSTLDTNWATVEAALQTFIADIAGSADVDVVIAKLTSDTERLQVALFNKDRERKQQVLRDAYGAADAATGAKGFLYPNLITVALKLKAQQEFQFSMNDTARDLIKVIMEWAKQNWQFAIEKGISAHSVNIEFNMKFGALLIENYKTELYGLIEAYKSQINIEIEKATHKLKEYMINIDLLKTQSAVLTQQDENRIKVYVAEIGDTMKRLELFIQEQQNQVHEKIAAYSAAAQTSATMAQSSSQIILGVPSA